MTMKTMGLPAGAQVTKVSVRGIVAGVRRYVSEDVVVIEIKNMPGVSFPQELGDSDIAFIVIETAAGSDLSNKAQEVVRNGASAIEVAGTAMRYDDVKSRHGTIEMHSPFAPWVLARTIAQVEYGSKLR